MTTAAPKQRQAQNKIIRNLYAPTRLRAADNMTVPIREVFKREYIIIDKNQKDNEIEFFLPTPHSRVKKFDDNQKYGSMNMMLLSSGEVLRTEVNIYDPNGLPFDFHTRDASGTITKEYEKLNELRRLLNITQVLHKLDTNDNPIEDKLDNYIHAPHIDAVSKRETSMYSRYSSSSRDSRLGRLLNIEIFGSHQYRLSVKNGEFLNNPILSGCWLAVEALVWEDQIACNLK